MAQKAYANSSLWYVLAAANALSGDSDLVAGTSLKVPDTGVAKNDSSTFKPYNPNEIVGSTSPGLPYVPPASGCGAVGMIIMAVVAIVVTIYTAGLATPGLLAGGGASLGAIFGAGVATLGGAGGFGLAVAAGALGGFVGSVASQAVGKALGVVDHFSLRQAVSAGIAGGISGGITSYFGQVGKLIEAGKWGKVAASAALNSAGSYAGNKIAGVPGSSFSWKSIAASAVTSVIAGKINKAMGTVYDKFNGSNQIIGQTIGGMVSGAIGLNVRRQFGFDDKVDYGSIVADAFGNALGNAVVSGAITRSSDTPSNTTESDWRKAAEMRMRQVAAEEEIERLGYAETIYLGSNTNSAGNRSTDSKVSLRSEIASLTPSERKRLAHVEVNENVHLDPETQRERTYKNVTMSFKILEDSKLVPIPMRSSLPVYSPLVSGYVARSASIEGSRQSAISHWNNSKLPGVAVTGRVFANVGYNILSSLNSVGSLITDADHRNNTVYALNEAVNNPNRVYQSLVSTVSDRFDRPWQENLESGAVFGIETLATLGTGIIVRRADGALGLLDDVVPTNLFDEIAALPPGARPNPTTYLSTEYIDSHLSQFEGGASYLTPKAALDRWGRDALGRADGQFVMPSSQLDEVLLKTQGDLSLVEKELGIKSGDWQGREFVRIDVRDPNSLNLRMPSGNETGANPQWIPAGKLPTGYSEAVINQIPKGSFSELNLWDSLQRLQQKP